MTNALFCPPIGPDPERYPQAVIVNNPSGLGGHIAQEVLDEIAEHPRWRQQTLMGRFLEEQ